MNILVSGSTGLVGTALITVLTAAGHEVIRLVRVKSRTPSKEIIGWDPAAHYIDAAGLEGLDAIVHLAGEPIASGRWNSAKKARIRGEVFFRNDNKWRQSVLRSSLLGDNGSVTGLQQVVPRFRSAEDILACPLMDRLIGVHGTNDSEPLEALRCSRQQS